MTVKIFVVGRPGSGKTAVVKDILEHAKNVGVSALRIQDYHILYNMYIEECKKAGAPKKFRSTRLGGFDVLDFSVFDSALVLLEEQVWAEINRVPVAPQLITIEFARNNYHHDWSQFSPAFIQDS